MAEAKYGPKKADHPSVGEPCPACHQPFQEGDYTALVILGPGDDEEARARARARVGRVYNAVALEVHWDCASEEARRPGDVTIARRDRDPRIIREGEPGFEKAQLVDPSNLGENR